MKVAFSFKTLFCLSVLLVCPALALDIPVNAAYLITEIEPGLVEIKIPHTGDVTYKNTSEAMENTSLREVPEMVIDVETIDYEFYADRYVHWQDVHVWDPYFVLIGDTDQDGMREIIADRHYGYSNIPPGESKFHSLILEITSEDTFQQVIEYPDSTNFPFWSGDLDNDESQEVLMRKHYIDLDSMAYGKSIQSYEAISSGQLPTELSFVFDQPFVSQINHPTLTDLDQDGELDMLYYLDGGGSQGDLCARSSIVAEYDPLLNNFVRKYCFTQPALYTSHFAIDDWDMDGQIEFATGGLDGEMYIVENTGDDTYEMIFEDTLDTYNAYMSTSTNDINGNGKPELWVGGDRSGSGTTISCFESNGNNEYENVFNIRLPGLFSFYDYGVANSDIDQDEIDELIIWTSGYIFILKNTGSETYEMIFAHRNNEGNEPLHQLYYSVTSNDLTGDGYPELLISMSNYVGNDRYYYTEIYQPSGVMASLSPYVIPDSRTLLKAFPNPFNGSITIQWPNIGPEEVAIKIFDIKGRLVKSERIPNNLTYQEGEYRWDATDNNGKEVSGGVFVISVANSEFHLKAKVVLLE